MVPPIRAMAWLAASIAIISGGLDLLGKMRVGLSRGQSAVFIYIAARS